MGLLFAVIRLILPLANNDTLKTIVLVFVLFLGGYGMIGVMHRQAVTQIQAGDSRIAEVQIQNARLIAGVENLANSVADLKREVGETKTSVKATEQRLWEFMLREKSHQSPKKASHTL